MGPWVHGGWARGDGDSLGDVHFARKTAEYFREKIQFPFFERHLKGGEAGKDAAEAYVFETGSNVWRRFDAGRRAGAGRARCISARTAS